MSDGSVDDNDLQIKVEAVDNGRIEEINVDGFGPLDTYTDKCFLIHDAKMQGLKVEFENVEENSIDERGIHAIQLFGGKSENKQSDSWIGNIEMKTKEKSDIHEDDLNTQKNSALMKLEVMDIEEHFLVEKNAYSRNALMKNTNEDNCSNRSTGEKGTMDCIKLDENPVPLNNKKHQCTMCEFSTPHKANLTRHIAGIHLNEKHYRCTICEFAAVLKSDLKRHTDSVHAIDKKFCCAMCEYATTRKDSMTHHIKTFHLKIRKHQCTICEFAAATRQNLRSHIDTVHLKIRKFSCAMCDYNGAAKQNLKSHMESVHLNIRKYPCGLCKHSARSKAHLDMHLRSKHPIN